MKFHNLLLGIALTLLLVGSGCSNLQDVLNLQRPTARLKGLSFKDVSLKSATLLFDVEVENPYTVDLPLANLDYQLTSKTNPFLAGNADLQSTIPAHGKEIVGLPVKVNYLELLKALKDVKPGSTIPYNADMGLSVNAPSLGKIRVPFKKEGTLDVPTISDASNLDWEKVLEKVK